MLHENVHGDRATDADQMKVKGDHANLLYRQDNTESTCPGDGRLTGHDTSVLRPPVSGGWEIKHFEDGEG